MENVNTNNQIKKTILITWWTWYIWSHAVVAFEQAWYKTVIIDNLSNSKSTTLENIVKIIWYKPDFFDLDLRDKENLETVFEKYNFDWVLHFAWLKAVWESCEKALVYFDNNIVWSIRLFECMEKYNVKNIIFSSSATVYDISTTSLLAGQSTTSPLVDQSTSSPLAPLLENRGIGQSWIGEDFVLWNCSNPYGTSKFLLENILSDLSKFAWFNVINLRYFNPIGAHHSWYLGEDPEGIPNNLLPYIMKVAAWELEKLKVFWDDYDTIDGTWVRDYIDVVDLIDGHLKAYEFLENLDFSWFVDNFNLWVGVGVSVLEMIKKSEEVTNKKINYEIVERREGDLSQVFCNPSKAKNILEWQAKTSLEDSLKNSWRFYNKK